MMNKLSKLAIAVTLIGGALTMTSSAHAGGIYPSGGCVVVWEMKRFGFIKTKVPVTRCQLTTG